jgi:hypothetical protein
MVCRQRLQIRLHYPIPGQWHFLTGYDGEPWHLRYVGVELASAVKNSYLSYDEYYTRYIGISDKSGSEDDAVGISTIVNVSAGGTAYTLSTFQAAGQTYFKLRDIAVILSGTDFEFDVAWDGEAKLIVLLVGTPYSAEPALSDFEPGQVTHMTAAQPPILIGDAPYELGALMVAGSNYFTLEELGALLDFTVTQDDDGALVITSAFTADAAQDSAA